MAENRLTKLPLLAQLGIAVVIALVILGAFWWFWYSPKDTEAAGMEQQLADLRQQNRALEATSNKLPEFKREVQALEARLDLLKRILPPEKEMPELMKRVQYLAAQSNLRVSSFRPSPVRQSEFYQEVPIALQLEGNFHNLGAFLDRVSRMSRLVNLGDLKIAGESAPTVNNTIKVTATATTYVYKEAPPGAAKPGARR
jgi:type IV pilus assembly protein PilO